MLRWASRPTAFFGEPNLALPATLTISSALLLIRILAEGFANKVNPHKRDRVTMRAMTTRYRAEQVGSLLRPPELLEARSAWAAGKIPIEGLRAQEDRAILAALEKQRAIGLDILSDGEVRRGSWLTDMADAVDGFVSEKVTLEWKGPGGGAEGSTAQVAGARLRKARKLTAHELPLLKQAAGGPLKSPCRRLQILSSPATSPA